MIPVYNAGQYLDRCLDSALQQTLNDIEVICVDDCSNDASFSILKHRAYQDERLTVVQHSENRGEGPARNSGIESARGKFVFHLDADDTLPEDAIETLYEAAVSNQSDMVKGGFAFVDPDGSVRPVEWSFPGERVVNTNIYESDFLQRIPTSHCSYLYRRDFLNAHGLRYRSDLAVGLDLVALTRTLLLATSVTLLPKMVYFYHQSAESAIRGKLSIRVPLDSIKAQASVCELLREAGFNGAADTRLQRWGYHIKEYWRRMPDSLTADECTAVFSEFRRTTAVVRIPWQVNTPIHQRHLLALIVAERDQEAIEFLRTNTAFQGFSDPEELNSSLEFVLTVAPGDPGTLIELGRLARRQGDSLQALSFFERVLTKLPDHIGAKIACSAVLRELDRFEEAGLLLTDALEQCLEGTEHQGAARRALAEQDRLYSRQILRTRSALQGTIDQLERERSELSNSIEESRSLQQVLKTSVAELDKSLDEKQQALNKALAEVQILRDQLALAHEWEDHRGIEVEH